LCGKQVFGPPPPNHATSALPQHGLARTSNWEFLGKSTSESESTDAGADLSVKLDFGLSSAGLDAETRKKWGYEFNLIYSVTLSKKSLTTSLVVTNDDDKAFEVQVLLHTYFRVQVCSFSSWVVFGDGVLTGIGYLQRDRNRTGGRGIPG
jgi:glucose-6-phosphate 1-epimerase